MAKPRYLVIGKTFIPTVTGSRMDPTKSVGSIIETDMSPGPHLKPLNQEARDRMELWYDEAVEYTKFDEAGAPEIKIAYPHRKYRIAPPGKAPEQHDVKVLRAPPKDMPGAMSLAETILKDPSTDQRPGPAVELSTEGWDEEDPGEGELVVVQEAPAKPSARKS